MWKGRVRPGFVSRKPFVIQGQRLMARAPLWRQKARPVNTPYVYSLFRLVHVTRSNLHGYSNKVLVHGGESYPRLLDSPHMVLGAVPLGGYGSGLVQNII